MYPTLGDLQTRLAEFHHDNRRREASRQFRFERAICQIQSTTLANPRSRNGGQQHRWSSP